VAWLFQVIYWLKKYAVLETLISKHWLFVISWHGLTNFLKINAFLVTMISNFSKQITPARMLFYGFLGHDHYSLIFNIYNPLLSQLIDEINLTTMCMNWGLEPWKQLIYCLIRQKNSIKFRNILSIECWRIGCVVVYRQK
jgi:hypothetical protein